MIMIQILLILTLSCFTIAVPPTYDAFQDASMTTEFLKALYETQRFSLFKQAFLANDVQSVLNSDQISELVTIAARNSPGLFDNTMITFAIEHHEKLNAEAAQSLLQAMIQGSHLSKASNLIKSESFMSKMTPEAFTNVMDIYVENISKSLIQDPLASQNFLSTLMMDHLASRVTGQQWRSIVYKITKKEKYDLSMRLMMGPESIQNAVKEDVNTLFKALQKKSSLPSDFVAFLIQNFSETVSPAQWAQLFENQMKSKNYESALHIAKVDSIWEAMPKETQWKVSGVNPSLGFETFAHRLTQLKLHSSPPSRFKSLKFKKAPVV